MINIFDKSTPLDLNNFKTLGSGVLSDFISEPIITEVLNAEYTLEFEYSKDGFNFEYLTEENIIKANGQLFRIWYVRKNLKGIYILAKHIVFDLQKNFLEDVNPTNKTGNQAISWILNNTQYPNKFEATGDCTVISSARYVRKNPIEAIYGADNAILKRFGGEIELDNFTIKLHQRRGNITGLHIRQGKNLTGAEYNLDLSTVATRIMPQGKDGLFLPEKYIDSPLINNYFNPFVYKAELDIGIDEEKGITEEMCYEEMRNAVNNMYINGIDKPSLSISIDFVELSKTEEYKEYSNLETAHLGDTINCYIPTFKLNIKTRIVKTIYNCLKKRIEKLELGTVQPDFIKNNVEERQNIENKIQEVNPSHILNQAKENASNLIKHPFNGYIHIDENTGEMYLMDNKNINQAQKIWKFGLGGIGFSENGINGTYETAITSNGEIVADFIKTGTINASLIQGYSKLQDNITQIEIDFNKIKNEVANALDLENEVNGNELTIEKAEKYFPIKMEIPGDIEIFNNLYPGDVYPSDDLLPRGGS